MCVLESDCLALIHTQTSLKHLAQCSQLQEVTSFFGISLFSRLVCNFPSQLPGVRRPRGATVSSDGEPGTDEVLLKEQQRMQKLLHDLKVSASRVRSSQLAPLVEIVTEFGTCLTSLVELMLSSKVEQVVVSVQEAASLLELETALGRVTRLGLEGNHLCRLVARHGGVRLLVEMLTSPKWLPARGSLLRTLGTVCCVLEAIRQLEEVRGVEVIARLVGDSGARESERAEAAGVLAQVRAWSLQSGVLSLVSLGYKPMDRGERLHPGRHRERLPPGGLPHRPLQVHQVSRDFPPGGSCSCQPLLPLPPGADCHESDGHIACPLDLPQVQCKTQHLHPGPGADFFT